jgi:Brp/Blh family beta-carotene 15,15'-monooxygenase
MAFFPLYLAGGGAMMLLWIASPAVALALFLGLTAWHWGSADAAAYPGGLAAFALRSTGRGLLVVSAPLVFHPGSSWEALSSLSKVFGPAIAAQTPGWLPGLAAGCFVLGLVLECLLVARDAWRLQRRRAARDSVELVLLLVLFYLVPPVAAVGVYFVAWHAWRHTLRTGALLDPEKAGRLPALVAAYHGRALPLTLASVVALAALTLAVGWESPQKLTAVYLVLLSALTVPHSVVVTAWDYRSRLARYRSRPLRDR